MMHFIFKRVGFTQFPERRPSQDTAFVLPNRTALPAQNAMHGSNRSRKPPIRAVRARIQYPNCESKCEPPDVIKCLLPYTRRLLFSDVVALVASVVQRMNPSIHAAYHHELYKPVCALSTLYDKLNGIEPAVSAAMVGDHAARMRSVLEKMHARLPPLVPGYAARIIDGNAIAATEHRLEVLRDTRSGLRCLENH